MRTTIISKSKNRGSSNPSLDVVIPQIPSLAAQIINHEGATYYGNL